MLVPMGGADSFTPNNTLRYSLAHGITNIYSSLFKSLRPQIFFISDSHFAGDERTMIYQNDICFHVNIIAEIGRRSSGNLGSRGRCTKFRVEMAKRKSSAEPQHHLFRVRPANASPEGRSQRAESRSCSRCGRAPSEGSLKIDREQRPSNMDFVKAAHGIQQDSRRPSQRIRVYVKDPPRGSRRYGNTSHPRPSAPQDF